MRIKLDTVISDIQSSISYLPDFVRRSRSMSLYDFHEESLQFLQSAHLLLKLITYLSWNRSSSPTTHHPFQDETGSPAMSITLIGESQLEEVQSQMEESLDLPPAVLEFHNWAKKSTNTQELNASFDLHQTAEKGVQTIVEALGTKTVSATCY